MSNDFKHLELALKVNAKRKMPKKMAIPFKDIENNKANRKQHSEKLAAQANYIDDLWAKQDAQRKTDNLPEISNKKPLLINVPVDLLDIDFLRRSFGFEIVCEFDDGIVITATEPEKLKEGITKINDFASAAHGTSLVANINNIITEETTEQRLKRILSDELLKNWKQIKSAPNDTITVEISIECQGITVLGEKPEKKEKETLERFQKRLAKWEEKREAVYKEWDELRERREEELRHYIQAYGGEIADIYDSSGSDMYQDSFDAKISISHKGMIDMALNYPYLFEIKEPEELFQPFMNPSEAGLPEGTFTIVPPDNDSPVVCVIDSGIQEGHAYIKDAILTKTSKCYLPGRKDIDDQVLDGGHGTRVAGAILYPDGVSRITTPEYQLPCFIANARLLDENNYIPAKLLPAKVLNQIIKEFFTVHKIKLFNHSIASAFPCLLKYMSSWAATIDSLTYEKDILLIQAAGNLSTDNTNPFCLGITQHLVAGRIHPCYLLENSARIANPAQSMQALTVGAINIDAYEDDDWISFGPADSVTSYSRTGFGLWGAIKPEVVEYGGDVLRNKTKFEYKNKQELLPELIRVSPPAYARDAEGTSFAAPKVAHIASQLQRYLPGKSGLLYKALIVQSARWTTWADRFPDDKKINVLRYIGYGLPNKERALSNDKYRVTYISSGTNTLTPGYVDIYQVKIPSSVRNVSNKLRIDVTLTFSAKPRRTRKGFRGYFSTWVDWTTSKFEENLEEFSSRVAVLSQTDMPELEDESEGSEIHRSGSIPWVIGVNKKAGRIAEASRNRSAAQKDWAVMDAYSLPSEFCIAVMGHKGWDTSGLYPAKYALCVSFEAVNKDIEIYEAFSEVEAAIPVEQEVEIDSGLESEG